MYLLHKSHRPESKTFCCSFLLKAISVCTSPKVIFITYEQHILAYILAHTLAYILEIYCTYDGILTGSEKRFFLFSYCNLVSLKNRIDSLSSHKNLVKFARPKQIVLFPFLLCACEKSRNNFCFLLSGLAIEIQIELST